MITIKRLLTSRISTKLSDPVGASEIIEDKEEIEEGTIQRQEF
jgi:hypothetical protein